MVGWYVVGVLGLALLMIVHEAGHFFAARAYGMRVTRFSIGFGPTFFKVQPVEGYYWFTTAGDRVRLRLWRHIPEKHGPTVFQVAMIPFLAYVQIAGMSPLDEIEPDDKGSYANASLLGRVATIFAGPFANYAFASVLFFLSLFIGGKAVASLESTEVTVIDGRPAASAGVQDGDRVLEVNGVPVVNWDHMAENIAKHPAEPISVIVDRKGERVAIALTPANESGKGKIGVAPLAHRVPVTVGEAAMLAVTRPMLVVRELVVGLSQYLRGKADGELAGPAGIVRETARAAKSGWTDLLYFLGALSAYLGAFNLIPFPALDGGRLMFLGYEATTRRRPNARIEAQVHFIGLFLMICLMAYVTVNDFRLLK